MTIENDGSHMLMVWHSDTICEVTGDWLL